MQFKESDLGFLDSFATAGSAPPADAGHASDQQQISGGSTHGPRLDAPIRLEWHRSSGPAGELQHLHKEGLQGERRDSCMLPGSTAARASCLVARCCRTSACSLTGAPSAVLGRLASRDDTRVTGGRFARWSSVGGIPARRCTVHAHLSPRQGPRPQHAPPPASPCPQSPGRWGSGSRTAAG